MLVQLTTPRIIFDPSRHEHHIYIHTLSKPDVSTGAVLFTGTTDPEHGQVETRPLDPKEILPLDGGLAVQIYVLPFWELFQGGPKEVLHDGEMVRAADLKISRYCTAGFQVIAKSAFRASPRTYEEHKIGFTLVFPATGGGVIRLSDTFVDITNLTFNPWACNPDPLPEAAKAELRSTYARTHALPDGRSDIDARRKARIAAAEASMRNEAAGAKNPTLPNDRVKALPPKPERCPTCDSPSPKRHPAMQFEGEVQVCRDPWHQT